MFAAITGIPEEEALTCDDFVTEAERYAILNEEITPQMREVPDPDEADQQGQQLTPACTPATARASPRPAAASSRR